MKLKKISASLLVLGASTWIGAAHEPSVKAQDQFGASSESSVFDILALEEKLHESLRSPLLGIVSKSAHHTNMRFQASLKSLKIKSFDTFQEKLSQVGYSGRTDEENWHHFNKIWLAAINDIFVTEQTDESQDDDARTHIDSMSEKTTLLNLLLRQHGSIDLEKKVQSLIELGAYRNLHREFSQNPNMENQSEYPIKIVLEEIGDNKIQKSLLEILLNTKLFDHESLDQEMRDPYYSGEFTHSLVDQHEYILDSLVSHGDFSSFDLFLTYLEDQGQFIINRYDRAIEQIEDQIVVPVLESILEKMYHIRRSSLTSDRNGTLVDNLAEFFKTKEIKLLLDHQNQESRFDHYFQNRIATDFSGLFENCASAIEQHRKPTEMTGESLKSHVLEWAKWANFRNRVAKHMNMYALSASNTANKSNVIKLIRYVNITANASDFRDNTIELFKELEAYGGKDIIFLRRNKLGWSPLMFAMMQKQSEGIQLYLRQAPHEIVLQDGVHNNILHLAFPLPESLYKNEHAIADQENVLHYIGAHLGDSGVIKQTERAIKAVLTEGAIDNRDKVDALTQISAANFTPVSLAAAMGFVDVYEYLVTFLKASNRWNRDDHAYLDMHIEEVLAQGIKAYLEHTDDSSEYKDHLENKLKEVEKRVHYLKYYVFNEVYHPESQIARELLDIIQAPVAEVFRESDAGTKLKKDPYESALRQGIDAFLKPKTLQEKAMEEKLAWRMNFYETKLKDLEVELRDLKDQERSVYSGIVSQFNYLRKASLFIKIDRKEKDISDTLIQIEALHNSDIEYKFKDMLQTTTMVKVSYLRPLVEAVTERYLVDHPTPAKHRFEKVYEGMCENRSMDYFKKTFNQVIESKIQEVIKEKMRRSGRLDEATEQEDFGTSRFDQLRPNHRRPGVFDAPQEDDDLDYEYSDQDDELI